MRNLFLFLARFRALMLFIILEGVALSMVYRTHLYHKASFVNSSNKLVGTIMGHRQNVVQYFQLKEENEKLASENARLRSQQILTDTLPAIDSLLPESNNKFRYTYIPARVVNNSLNHFNNFITLDKGSAEGIQPTMGVIDSRGVVGVISDVSENFSLVQSAVNINSFISVRHKKSGSFGTLTWTGKNPFLLDVIDMSKSAVVKKGDTIVTSGFSTFFPPDHTVGIVHAVNPATGSGFLDIQIVPTNDFGKLNFVYVVQLDKKKELDTLESRASSQINRSR
jgi:rod shape-determining protein MreC